MSSTDRKRIKEIVEAQGYHIDIDRWPARVTFYKKTGQPMPNLPADPWSMERYLRKGFTLTPPAQPSNGDNGTGSESLKELAKAKRKKRAERKTRKHEGELVKGERNA